MIARRRCSGPEAEDTKLSATDRLFTCLDQCRIRSESGAATLEILGIHVTPGAGSWVQLAVVGEPRQGVLMHLPPAGRLDDAVAALLEWGRTPQAERPRAIDLTPVV